VRHGVAWRAAWCRMACGMVSHGVRHGQLMSVRAQCTVLMLPSHESLPQQPAAPHGVLLTEAPTACVDVTGRSTLSLQCNLHWAAVGSTHCTLGCGGMAFDKGSLRNRGSTRGRCAGNAGDLRSCW